MHRSAISELLTYAKYAAHSLSCLAQNSLAYLSNLLFGLLSHSPLYLHFCPESIGRFVIIPKFPKFPKFSKFSKLSKLSNDPNAPNAPNASNASNAPNASNHLTLNSLSASCGIGIER